MHFRTISCAFQMVKYITLVSLVLSMMDVSVGLPSSSRLVNDLGLVHVIKTRSASQKYCGRHIVNILSMLCAGNYFSPAKRNNFNQQNNHQDNIDTIDPIDPIDPIHTNNNGISSIWDDMTPKGQYNKPMDSSGEYFLEPKDAFDMFGSDSSGAINFSRNRRGIVDECCKKACNIMELMSYCE